MLCFLGRQRYWRNLFLLLVIVMGGCARSVEDRKIEDFVSLWKDIKPWYTNQIGLIASRGLLDPQTVNLMHKELVTNKDFIVVVTQKFFSVESYVNVFSNITIHYVYVSFSEGLDGRSPDVLVREIEDILARLSELSPSSSYEVKRAQLTLLRTRLEQYQELQKVVSSNWIKAVYRSIKQLHSVYHDLTK